MNLTHYKLLDELLSTSLCDSLEWNQNGQFEKAESLLANFESDDWAFLAKNWQSKNNNWKRCLASVLTPYMGEHSQNILINMATTKNPELAMEAMYAISFYCGINENYDGLYRDKEIVHQEFKSKLIKQQFADNIPKIEKCIAERFDLLKSILTEA